MPSGLFGGDRLSLFALPCLAFPRKAPPLHPLPRLFPSGVASRCCRTSCLPPCAPTESFNPRHPACHTESQVPYCPVVSPKTIALPSTNFILLEASTLWLNNRRIEGRTERTYRQRQRDRYHWKSLGKGKRTGRKVPDYQ